ncbi:glycosyltransferase family 4 protein [Solwaraspora sp. WMMD791]|uniref:glycosyltransferase family 4 protein n=1 Tax=Solwaraspora sp. WMMD791 TaxID=3016086 RepID=UPI002499D26B|nr:glycosyltransferase family 4 protein [Solwaraspora sp. WMMD791]WFE30329.1 glycosyltransferase family 4 protein [Solwaraspora sp. WMMD791]
MSADGIVLIVDHQLPTPDRDSGSLRLRRVIDELRGLGRQVLFFPMHPTAPSAYAERLRRDGVGVVSDRTQQHRFLAEQGHRIALALLCRPEPAVAMLGPVRDAAPRALIAYDTVDLHFHRLGRQAALAREAGSADRYALRARAESMRAVELMLAAECDVTLVVSDDERQLVAAAVPTATVAVLSNIHQPDGPVRPPADNARILFVGNYRHQPNVDAARWLCAEVLPAVRARVPTAVVDLVGDGAPPEVATLAGTAVTVHGWVPDLRAVYARARVAVAPLRYGAGVKGKVGEAVEYGVPVVGTAVAFEGMGLRPGRDVLAGETAEELAAALVRVLRDDALAARLAAASRPALAARCGVAAARSVLRRLLQQAADRQSLGQQSLGQQSLGQQSLGQQSVGQQRRAAPV